MGFTIEVKIDMFCRVWSLYHDFPISFADGIGMTTTLSQEKSGGNQKLVEFFEAGSILLRVVGAKALQFSLQHQIPSPFCVFMVVVSKGCLCSSHQMGWEIPKLLRSMSQNHQAKTQATLSLWSVSHQATRLGVCWKRYFIRDPKEPSKNGNYAPAEMWDQAIECTSCTISRHVESTSRWESHRSTTPSRHEAHPWNKWHHVQLLMRHWMFRQDSKWQSQHHPWWFWFPKKFLHHPIVRRPTTRSACRACWRAKRNRLRTPDVRAARRWELPEPRALWGRHDGEYAIDAWGKWLKMVQLLITRSVLVMMLLIIVDLCSKSARILFVVV